MQLSPEERHKIYEEEKARIDAEQKQRVTTGGSTTGLEPNIAGLLCYLGGWISHGRGADQLRNLRNPHCNRYKKGGKTTVMKPDILTGLIFGGQVRRIAVS